MCSDMIRDRLEDTGKRVPNKVTPPPQDMYNVYSMGKSAESLGTFVKQKTGFNVSIFPSLLASTMAHFWVWACFSV